MNLKILISLNSQTANLATFSMSLGASFICLLIFGYFGILIGVIFVFQATRFLRHYEVFWDTEYFYFSRYYYNEIEMSKDELVNFSKKKGYFNFTVCCLEFKNGRRFKFIEIPKSILEPRDFPIRQILDELVSVNAEKSVQSKDI